MADYSSGFLGAAVGSARRRADDPGTADLEAGVSGSSGYSALCSPSSPMRRRASYRALVGSLSPRSGGGGSGPAAVARFFCEPACEEEPRHFLDSCFLCKKPLGGNRDIFMYRGDTPFCSEECRQEQIEMDEAKENNYRNVSMKAASASRKEQQKASAKASQSMQVRTAGTVVAG